MEISQKFVRERDKKEAKRWKKEIEYERKGGEEKLTRLL